LVAWQWDEYDAGDEYRQVGKVHELAAGQYAILGSCQHNNGLGMNHAMDTLIAGVKIGATMAGSAFCAVIIDNTTNVPLVWLVASGAALAGGVWKISSVLTRIDDRLTALEKRNDEKDAREESRAQSN
jgi:hypothetical protein